MFSPFELAIASDIDIDMINPSMSDYDKKIAIASNAIRKWMRNPVNRKFLDEKKANYLHDKGWSVDKTLKDEATFPQEAYVLLPQELRRDPIKLRKWVAQNHPYLLHRSIT